MKILAIETTGPNASVALINENREVEEVTSDKTLSHLQNLIPMIDDLLEKCKLKIGDVTHIAVSEGPGSFTGIRIGMATGKALAQALDLPAISVPTLRSFAWNTPDFPGLICPLFDARRDQVYAGAYYWGEGRCYQAVRDDAWSLEGFLSEVLAVDPEHKKAIRFFGDGIRVFEGALREWAISTERLSANDDMSRILAEPERRLQRAASVAMAALQITESGGSKDYELLRPVYLRKAEAERKLAAKGTAKGTDPVGAKSTKGTDPLGAKSTKGTDPLGAKSTKGSVPVVD